MRQAFCMGVALWALLWAWDNQAAEVPMCWQEGRVSTHPLFHQDWREAKEPVSSETLRIAVLMDHRTNRDWQSYIGYLQGAFDNSGVDVAVEVACFGRTDDVPLGTLNSYYYVRDNYSQEIARRHQADLVSFLGPRSGDGYCGVASVSQGSPYVRTNVTTCDRPHTFAHEVGHNLGLHHAHQTGYKGRKGYCEVPEATARDCERGTIMSYAGSGRVQRFADVDAGWGTVENTAVQWLREYMPTAVSGYELGLDARTRTGPEQPLLCLEASPRVPVWPIRLAAPRAAARGSLVLPH